MTTRTPPLDQLVSCLMTADLVEERSDGSRWTCDNLAIEGGHLIGGQLLGQAIAIAARLDPSKAVKSISAIFPRPLRDTGSVTLEVTTLHTGRAYSMYRFEVRQPNRAGEPAVGFSAHVICHQPSEGVDHELPVPAGAGTPEDARPVDLGLIPWETRAIGDVDLNDRREQPNEFLLWNRAQPTPGEDPVVHQALLAFLSELTFIGTALLPHREWSQLDAHVALRTAVISHGIVFHRPYRLDDWLLLSHASPAAAGGSAYGAGQVHTGQGHLVASVNQESMIQMAPEAHR